MPEKKNHPTRAQGCSRRKSANDAGGRVRARRDGAHSKRQARCAIDKTGNRDRVVKGSPRRSEARAAEKRPCIRGDTKESAAGSEARRKTGIAAPIEGEDESVEARITQRGIASRAIASRQRERPRAQESRPTIGACNR